MSRATEILKKFIAYHNGYDAEMGVEIDDLVAEAKQVLEEGSRPPTPFEQLIRMIEAWGADKGILAYSSASSQHNKLKEESAELWNAIGIGDREGIKDGIGDCLVVLTLIAKLEGLALEECAEHAYGIISKRRGKMDPTTGLWVKTGEVAE